MSGKQNSAGQGASTSKDARASRLATALRANLKRRKQQAKSRAAAEKPAAAAGRESAGD